MKNMKIVSRLAVSLTIVLGLVALTPVAQADPLISGSIGFSGQADPDTGDWATADAVVFGGVIVSDSTGDYSGYTFGTSATFTDFTFDPALSPNPVLLWDINAGEATFSLSSVTIVTQVSGFLNLTGTGTLSMTGFDDTTGVWTFTGTSSGGSFTFGSTAAAASVPEPAPALLLGLGLLGITGVSLRRRFSTVLANR